LVKPHETERNHNGSHNETIEHLIVIDPLLGDQVLNNDRQHNQLNDVDDNLLLSVHNTEELELNDPGCEAPHNVEHNVTPQRPLNVIHLV